MIGMDCSAAPFPYEEDMGARARCFLAEAICLWDSGRELAAAMVARAAIEMQLCNICTTDPRVIHKKRPSGLYAAAQRLADAGVIDWPTAKQFRSLNARLCAAAHGSRVTYTGLGDIMRTAAVIVNQWSVARAMS